jgi:hypothetical protein
VHERRTRALCTNFARSHDGSDAARSVRITHAPQ